MPTDTTQIQFQNRFKAALEARRARLDAMPESHIQRPVRLDLLLATASVTETVRTFDPELRAALVDEYRDRATNILDGLETTACAARQAEAELDTREDSTDVAAIHEEVMTMYERLFTDATSLVQRGLLPKERLAVARDLKSYQGTLQSLIWILEIFSGAWSTLSTETPVKVADLERAAEIASRMTDALGDKSHAVQRAAAMETRTRALSLLVREYEELRRMVTFVRWFEGDADDFVPSLYATRGPRKPKGVDADDDVVTGDEEPVTPVPGPVPNNGGPAFG